MDKKNYITILGYKQLQDELHDIVVKDRPLLVQTINWAASNGDRSENADYIYGKKRLRELDKRIRILTKKIESAEVVDHLLHQGNDKIFFGAKVTILRNNQELTVKIVGQDEIDPKKNYISWTSPLAKNLLGKSIGDIFKFHSLDTINEIEILDVTYS